MAASFFSDQARRDGFHSLLTHIAQHLDAPVSVKLWDGEVIPLGPSADPNLCVAIKSPGVVTSLLRRPTADNLLRHYALGNLNVEGADLLTFIQTARQRRYGKRLRALSKTLVAKKLFPFLFGKAESTDITHRYAGDEIGRKRVKGENKDFIQFHYDLSNEFYELFLDPEMVYSCAYFTDWNNSLEQAQQDKLDMICKKLRMQPGERFLDIGCGWGALICHAARHYGVVAHGITLSERQLAHTHRKIAALGLTGRVTAELRDYQDLTGQFDKISSIGMVEHVGIDNMRGYMQTVSKLLPDRGMFLNHGITRRAKATEKDFRRVTPERRLLAKYIFPGGELDHIGHMLRSMENSGFEVHDVEGWRDHYAKTCEHWTQRLEANKDKAIAQIGEERYRMWLLYLAGVALTLGDGGACIFQTVATRHIKKGVSGLPSTREHLYRPRPNRDAKAA